MSDDEILAKPFEWRAEQILSRAFGGMHHVYGLKKEPGQWVVNHYGDLSTFDYNALTLLVLGAHHYCCRMSIKNSGPGLVKLILWPRFTRDRQDWCRAHPTIEEAIERYSQRPSNQSARQMALGTEPVTRVQQWHCRRCDTSVNLATMRCQCMESPNPWEPVSTPRSNQIFLELVQSFNDFADGKTGVDAIRSAFDLARTAVNQLEIDLMAARAAKEDPLA